ncbi:MAG: glycerophosphodiester phosphodiesterase [Halodesulfurarchaeum sp.]
MDVICHRRCPTDDPENTAEAARDVSDRVDMVEVDLRRCGSGEIVVFHDRTLDRLTERSAPVAETSLSELQTATIDDTDATIPTLEELLVAIPAGIGVNLELKEPGMADAVTAAARSTDRAIIVSSFDPHTLEPLREVSTAFLFDPETPEDWERGLETAIQQSCSFVHPQ